VTKREYPLLNHINRPIKTPREEAAALAERVRAARAHAEMVLVGPPRPNSKPEKQREGYYNGFYTGLTWRGKRIVIPKNKWGW
jgi:hypothetical protein